MRRVIGLRTLWFPLCIIPLLTPSLCNSPGDDESCLLQTSVTSLRKGRFTNSEHYSRSGVDARPRQTHQPVPEFRINLDLPPEERLVAVTQHFRNDLQDVYNQFSDQHFLELSRRITKLRGKEDAELMGEITGIAKTSGIPVYFIQAMLYTAELESLKGPWAYFLHSMNMTLPSNEKMMENLAPHDVSEGVSDFQELLSSTGFGCTGIIARDANGSVYHARNLDIGPGPDSGRKSSYAHWVQNVTYNAVFTKGGKEIFTGQTNAYIPGVYTGIRKGSNGYGVELNSRYVDHGIKHVMKHIFTEHRRPMSWIMRKIMEENEEYEGAVEAFSTTPYPSPVFNMVSGVKKGTILARDPDGLAYKVDLGSKKYIVMTNYDYMNMDNKAWADTVKSNTFGHWRRLAAEKMLNASKVVDTELLQKVLSDEAVMGKETIFQAIMNVEKGTYTSRLPQCLDC